ncbi:MAG: ABC transporter ATP-binding protein [Patescibacteria group bacterium]
MQISFSQVSKFIWSYLRKSPWWLAGVLILIVLQTGAEIMMPQLFGMFADTLAENSNNPSAGLPEIWKILVLIGITGISYWTFDKSKNIFWDTRWLPMMKKIQQDALFRVQRFSTDWHVDSFAGATVRKITRAVWAANSFVVQFLFTFIPLSILILGMIGVMFWRWKMMGLILAGGAVIYTLFSIWIAKYFIAPRARAATRTDTKIGAVLADSISCNSTVKIFGRENSEDKIFERIAEKWKQKHWKLWLAFNLTDISQAFIMTAFKFGLLVPAVWLWVEGLATVGDVVFVLASYNLVSSHLRHIGERIRETQKSANEMEDILEFSLMPFFVADAKGAKNLEVRKGEIELRNVNFRYSNQQRAIFKNLSLKIKAGEKIALVGRSGGGKTTFVKLLQRLHDLNSGKIEIDRQDISQITQKSLRRAIGLVPQDPILFHRSLAENISYGRPQSTLPEIRAAARLAHADEFISKLPKKYDTLVGERGVKLSGGERQRVAIARAMLADTPILILDEATSSLDSVSEKLIQDALKKLMEGKTVIIVAHRLSTIRSADRILVFENGKIIEEGTHFQLLRRDEGIYRKLFELQAGGFIGE